MRSPLLVRRTLPVLGLALVLVSGLVVLARQGEAVADEVLRANSVCEAHELRARKAENPQLAIEIPPEFDRPLPSREACLSHAAAWDEEAPGPKQPIPFSHAHHAGRFQIPCLYCHSGTERSRMAGMPSVQLCMGCHQHFAPEYDQLEGIRILKEHWAEEQPIAWLQIHRLPEHVKFRHNRHVAAGLECQTCHGQVQEMDKLHLVPDTSWWHYGMPAQKLEMGWCIQCHNEREASRDCLTCHY